MGEDGKDPPRASSGLNNNSNRRVQPHAGVRWKADVVAMLYRKRILGYRCNAGIPKPLVRSDLCLGLGSHKKTPSQDVDI